ncbi:hypothetical protein GCM10027449_18510 [Sinomonas notoginsengisoli]
MVKGSCHEIACAVIKDGRSPAGEALNQLTQGMWEADPDAETLPDDAQISDADLFLTGLEFFANNGVPHSPSVKMNSLNYGIWEFKVRRKRFSFYETDGRGGKFDTRKITDRDQSLDPYDEYFWHVPDFQKLIRLGHCFGKDTQSTTDKDLRRCRQVRQEDLEHDRG